MSQDDKPPAIPSKRLTVESASIMFGANLSAISNSQNSKYSLSDCHLWPDLRLHTKFCANRTNRCGVSQETYFAARHKSTIFGF